MSSAAIPGRTPGYCPLQRGVRRRATAGAPATLDICRERVRIRTVKLRRLFWPAVAIGALGVLLGLMALAFTVIRTDCRVGPKAREAVLRTDLRTFRDVIDQFHSDRGVYPLSLEALIEEGYLRSIPVDPMTRSAATWVPTLAAVASEKRVVNVHSGSTARGSDGQSYSDW